MNGDPRSAVTRIRAAIKDRAVWLALLHQSFARTLPPEEVERRCRAAIFEFGRRKAALDPTGLDPAAWVNRHIAKGSADVFASSVEIDRDSGRAIQQMTHCPLVEAWRELGCSATEVALLCDIAMEGDRGRAAAHGLSVTLEQSIGRGDPACLLVIEHR